MSVLEVQGVSKCYRNGTRANDEVELAVDGGEVFGLLGPNGAGKTTLVGQVLGLLRPDTGSIVVAGVDVVARPDVARRLCSYQPQAAAPVDGLSAREAVELVGRIRGGTRSAVRRRAANLLEALDLAAVADRPVPMSGGMARLTGFCMAAVVPGQVVVLDEPTNDVDPLRRRALWSLIRELADAGSAVLLVTHNVLEAERCVDRLAILAGGQVRAAGTPGGLKAALGAPLRLEYTVDGETAPPPPPALGDPTVVGRRHVLQVQLERVPEAVQWAKDCHQQGSIAEFAITPASLEDVYASWVSTDGAAA